MSKPTVSAAGGAMPAEGHKTRRDLPPFESDVYLLWFTLCHRRLQALYRIGGGRQQPGDPNSVTGVEQLLAIHSWTARDFGFVDPPMFDLKANTGTVFAAQDAVTVN